MSEAPAYEELTQNRYPAEKLPGVVCAFVKYFFTFLYFFGESFRSVYNKYFTALVCVHTFISTAFVLSWTP